MHRTHSLMVLFVMLIAGQAAAQQAPAPSPATFTAGGPSAGAAACIAVSVIAASCPVVRRPDRRPAPGDSRGYFAAATRILAGADP